jgi:protease I
MEASGKRIAILVESIYEDPELWYPYYRMQEAGAEVVLVGPEAGVVYESKHGYPAKSDVAAADVKGQDFDAVIVPGGFSPDRMRRSPDMVRFLREANEAGKIVASICHGPWMLISAGATRGRRVTSVANIKDDLVNSGATWVDEEVVQDGNMITSRTPVDLPVFCRTILAAL